MLDLLSEVGLLDCKQVDTPIVQNHKIGECSNQVPTTNERYTKLVGKLIYLSHTPLGTCFATTRWPLTFPMI